MTWPNDEAVVLFKRKHDKAVLPAYATPGSVGMDLVTPEPFVLGTGEYRLVMTGWSLALQEGFEAQIRPRSGLAYNRGITVLNSPGTIDSDYRGELGVILINHSQVLQQFEEGDKIAQMVIAPVCLVLKGGSQEVDELPKSERGEGGFGSTGR